MSASTVTEGAVIVPVSVPPHPLGEGQPQKTSAGTLARGADLHEGTLIDASALRDLEPALGPAGPLVHLLPQAHGREVGSSARETGGCPEASQMGRPEASQTINCSAMTPSVGCDNFSCSPWQAGIA
jgi:hypothetical protein